MTIAVANVNTANTFGHWLQRTNELAAAMSQNCLTVGGNPAVGNAEIHGVFSSNTVAVASLTGFGSSNVTFDTANFILSNTASFSTLGTLNINGPMNVGSVSTIKIAGSNTTHQVLSAIDANGTLGFVQVAFPLDQLTDVDSSNVGAKDNETILKWSVSANSWVANTLSLINSTRINTLNVGTITSTLVVTANANIANNTLFVNNSSRRVGIGTTAPGAPLHVAGSAIIDGDIQGFNTSDETFKDNIVDLDSTDALMELLKIRVIEFDWNEEAVENSDYVAKTNKGHDVGFSAQQIKSFKPEWVIERPDGTLAVNYEKVIPYLVAVLQSQYKE